MEVDLTDKPVYDVHESFTSEDGRWICTLVIGSLRIKLTEQQAEQVRYYFENT